MAQHAMVGSVEVMALVDVTPPPFDPTQFFPQTTPETWAPYRDHLDENGRLPVQFGFFALRTPDGTIVVDTGLGPGPHARFGGDHIGWNVTSQDGKPRATFPRARYYLPKADWDYFTKPDVLQGLPSVQMNVVALERLGVVDLVEGDRALTAQVSLLATPGHTPGHQCVLISSQGQKGIIVGDLFHSAVQATEPSGTSERTWTRSWRARLAVRCWTG